MSRFYLAKNKSVFKARRFSSSSSSLILKLKIEKMQQNERVINSILRYSCAISSCFDILILVNKEYENMNKNYLNT